jgi:hypothetical protein
MNTSRFVSNRYRQILIASLLSSGSLLALNPALADQNTPTPGTPISNQATAEFTDSADTTNTAIPIVSDIVSVTVGEVAGITISTPTITGTLYPGSTVNYEFIIKNDGNDQSQFFIPNAPSIATVNGASVTAGTLLIAAYSSDGILANEVNLKTGTVGTAGIPVTTSGTTGTLIGTKAGVNGGSVPAGGYIKVIVPITIPTTATSGQAIVVTLGNTSGQPGTTGASATTNNLPYVIGANGAASTGNDVYTHDNSLLTNGDAVSGNPINGDSLGRQEASASGTTAVVIPKITISGKVWDDANGSGTSTFTNINSTGEAGTQITNPLYAILVRGTGNTAVVVQSVAVSAVAATKGEYSFTNIDGFQTGLSVILSTTQGTAGLLPPATALPTNWVGTTPISRALATTGSANVPSIDFGIEQLPNTTASTATNYSNPPGSTKYVVPTLTGTDPEDGTLTKFKILTLPDPTTQGILYYNNGTTDVQVAANDIISSYDSTKLKFDPVNGNVTMSFDFASIDAAGKEDPSPATATMTFGATNVTISGTVWNDKNNNGIFDTSPLEAGTNGVNGTSTISVKVVLLDMSTPATPVFLQAATVDPTTGAYTFSNVTYNKDVKVMILNNGTSAGAGDIPTDAVQATLLPDWVGTSATTLSFNTGLINSVNKNFGIRQKPKVVLVKRITKINTTAFTTYNDNPGRSEDNNTMNWPSSTTGYLLGSYTGQTVKPGDTIEYTIYFLNNQGSDAAKVKICDAITGAQTYNADSMKLSLDGAAEVSVSDSNTDTSTDRASTYTATEAASLTGCNLLDKTVPGVKIDITGATAASKQPNSTGLAAGSYGYFRFTTTVKP